ncbi:LysR family transcriptional regulator [Paracoccus aestuariivivens]|uniref:LysR family transcriptional regulator n=1 Tax=Paracoccus aestuariivivens TaxID=1820333 RepID=A0A6L6J9Z0_9RHOB|nr:LysR family transcriptional regulator [Paracoccus aestuariivivens]MTH78983.1 LysR family transcriptional regulator [Paracoccus aestuariivivens]
MSQLTIRQVEVIRAVMMAGTIQGAAALLNVSAPGVSRLVKYSEDSLGIRLFDRKGGLFVPSAEAASIFEMIHQVHHQMDNLNYAVRSLRQGEGVRLSFASAPSIAQFIAARVIRGIRGRFPELFIDLNILKIEETTDYLLLDRGEFVVMSSAVTNPALSSEPLATGRLMVIVPDGHRLAQQSAISIHDLEGEDLIGVDPDDPYGAALARPFADAGVKPSYAIRGRFAQTVVSLVRHGLGVALIDEFSVAEVYMPGLTRRPLIEEGGLTAWVVTRKGRPLSSFAELTISQFRREFAAAIARHDWDER